MIWQIQGLHNKAAVQRDFLKYVAGLCELSEEYKFSSARFYIENRNDFSFLSHYEGAG